MSIAHESNYSDSNRNSFYQNKSPIKKTSLVTENTPPQSYVSSMDIDEENSTYDEQNDTSNNKRQTKCKDTIQQISSSSSIVSNNSSTQTNHLRSFKSGFHQRVLNTSPATNSFENIYVGKSFLIKFNNVTKKICYIYFFLIGEEKISRMEKLYERLYVRLEEINKKADTIIMNQGRLNRSLLPNEKRFQRPINLPTLPVRTEDELNLLETFLENDNFIAAVSKHLFLY